MLQSRSLALALIATALLYALPAGAETEQAFDVHVLDPTVAAPSVEQVVSGSLDDRFGRFRLGETRRRGGAFWLRLTPLVNFQPETAATLNVRKGRHLTMRVFMAQAGAVEPLRLATELPAFRAAHDALYVLPHGLATTQPLYAYVEPVGSGSEELRFSASTMEEALARGAEQARMIAFTFGGLMAMAVAALLIWLVLSDQLLSLYATMFALQAIYVAYFTGQGFDWPLLRYALPIASYAWNVPAALSGAVACLFVREIAELKRFLPRAYAAFGWLAVVFGVLAVANLGELVGLQGIVAAFGNLLFVGVAAFTLIVAFIAWRKQSRAAGWFLVAWGLLEAFTIATALRLLFTQPENATGLLYYGLPLSMVAAAVLIALGVADRLREQRIALTEAERRAQTDSLTGVLNRRTLLDRLDTACLRARARALPIALLFIDLDHFKEINDTFGHAAGDACLRAVIDPIQAELRQSDVIGRYGGEEFVVILSSADVTAAQLIAERICKRVADAEVTGYGAPIRLTCSIGIATSDTLGVWGEHLIARADEAVYAAKRSGRNRVQLAAPLPA